MSHRNEPKRFTVNLAGMQIDLVFWIKIALAIGILFIIPLEFSYIEDRNLLPVTTYYDIWIGSALVDYISSAGQSQPTTEFSNPLTIAAAITICIPAIILNRRIRNQKATDSVRDIAAASFFSTVVMTVYIVHYFPPAEILWLVDMFPQWKLTRFGTLVIIALIILPLMIREASHQGFRRRHRVLAFAMLLAAVLIPIALVAGYPEGRTNYLVISPAYQFSYYFPQINISFSALETMSFMYGLMYTGLHFMFGFNVLRYLQGQVTGLRAFLLGVASILVSSGYILYQTVVADAAFPVGVLPLPFLLLLGTAILIVSEPIAEGPTKTTIDSMPLDESITVPLVYILKSKLVGFKERVAGRRDPS